MVLVFDVEGDMALFRKPYTTTSMVSYPFPPPTAVAGLIAAIVGINHGAGDNAKNAHYWESVLGARIAIGLLNPISWINTAVNLMKIKTFNEYMNEHIQVKHQLVKKPRYRIYVQGGEIYDQLKQMLQREEFIYTPYMGSVYALADVKYIGEYEAMKADVGQGFSTVVPGYEGLEMDIVRSGSVFSENVPVRMTKERRLSQTVQVYYSSPDENGAHLLYVRSQGDLQSSVVNGEKVAWFNAW